MAENELGIEEVRIRIGDLVDDAHFEGRITHITRRGRHVASIVPAGLKATALPPDALEAAIEAAWPGLPPGITVGEARRRVIAALNAAHPYLLEPEERDVFPDLDRLQGAIDLIQEQVDHGYRTPPEKERMKEVAADLKEVIRRTKAKLTHEEIVTRAVRAEKGTWDAARAKAVLIQADQDVDERRARTMLRRICAKGLLTRTSVTRAVYEAVE